MNVVLNSAGLKEYDIKFYNEQGFFVIRNLIRSNFVEEIKNEILFIIDKIGLNNSKLRQTTQYLEGSLLDSLINSDALKKLAGIFIGGESSLYMPFTAVKSGNGGGQFHFHQDNQYTQFDRPGINFWFALSKMSINNGCLQVVPKSHLSGTFESELSGDGDNHKKIKWTPTDFKALQMNPGDCAAFSRLTIHGSGPNNSDENRIAYAVQFHRDDVKARWNENDWILLKEHPRWKVSPVKEIISLDKENLDGH